MPITSRHAVLVALLAFGAVAPLAAQPRPSRGNATTRTRRPRTPPRAAPVTPTPPVRPPAPVAPLPAGPYVVSIQNGEIGQQRDPSCVARRGCAAPRVPPPCAAGVSSIDVTTAWARRNELRGRSVSVQGMMIPLAACTELACVDTCCNGCFGSLALTMGASEHPLRLGLPDDPALTCRGDDSAVCCGTEVSGDNVIATGTLAPAPDTGGEWRIENVTLCALPPARCGTE